ncbi:MAG TPA: YfhO family protein [Paludibaculum sp.]|jgi:hypothetical protein
MAEIHHLDSDAPPQPAPVRDLHRWPAALLLIVIITGFYWKLILTPQFTWLAGPDIVTQVLPWYQFQASEWHAGRIPLWEPNQWFGQPLIGQAQPGVAYPLNWVLFALPLRDGWIKQVHLHVYFVLIHLMAAWFAYKLARELKCRRLAAVFGASIFSLAGWLGSTEWPQMINGAVWAPLVFLYLFRATKCRAPIRSSILAGFFLGMAWLSGHHQIPIFTSLACAGVWIWSLYENRERRLAAAFLVFWAMAGATAAVQILPAQEYGRLAHRWVGVTDPISWDQKVPYDVHKTFNFKPPNLLGIVIPGYFEHSDPFLGTAALSMALLGITLAWRRRETRVLTSVAIGGLLFSLAHHTVFHGLLYALVPNVEKARSASMAIFIFGFCASMLAAIGLHHLLDRPESPWPGRLARSAAIFGGFIFATRFVIMQVKGFPGITEDRSMVIALAALLLCATLLGKLAPRTVALCLLGLFLVEVTNSNGFFFPSVEEKNRTALLRTTSEHSDIAAFLRRQPGMSRFETDESLLAYNFGDWYGLPQANGYLASITSNVVLHETHQPAAKRLLGVAYRIGNAPTEYFQEDVFTSRTGLKVYRHSDVLPRAFSVHRAVRIQQRNQAPAQMKDIETRTFMLQEPPALAECAGTDRVVIQTYKPTQVKLAASMSCRGMVILADTWFPGWQATVDGKDTPIYEAYGLVRGVVLESGAHSVEFNYRPRSVIFGALLTLLAALVAASACLLPRLFPAKFS